MATFEYIIVDKPFKGKKRLSLAYAYFEEMPQEILSKLGHKIHFLDLSYNNFKDLSFLAHFPHLETLVLDRNCQLDCQTLPPLQDLRILWLNNCNLININEWLLRLQTQCPNLKDLSMMCNPVGATVLNGVPESDERVYRKEVLNILPQLSHFDGEAVNVQGGRRTSSWKLILRENVMQGKMKMLWRYSARLKNRFRSFNKFQGVLEHLGRQRDNQKKKIKE